LATRTQALWASDRSQTSVDYSDVNGAISTVNWNVIAGYTTVVTIHQLNPPKPDILVPPVVGPSSGSQTVPNGYNLVFVNAKTGWRGPAT
jgi:hypothetical protein